MNLYVIRLINIGSYVIKQLKGEKIKWKKYQKQAELYQNKDIDTFEQFKENFESIIISKDVNSAAYIASTNFGFVEYIENQYVTNGKFIGGMNDHHKHKRNSNEFNLSEIAFNQIVVLWNI